MIEKIKKVISSLRFWIVTVGAISAYLAFVDVNGFSLNELFNALALWLGTVAGIGTVDRFSEKIGQK